MRDPRFDCDGRPAARLTRDLHATSRRSGNGVAVFGSCLRWSYLWHARVGARRWGRLSVEGNRRFLPRSWQFQRRRVAVQRLLCSINSPTRRLRCIRIHSGFRARGRESAVAEDDHGRSGDFHFGRDQDRDHDNDHDHDGHRAACKGPSRLLFQLGIEPHDALRQHIDARYA